MSEEAERWKEKYLRSLEQQEQLENRWAARLDLLRRGLVRSTLAAEGSDKAVDQCMEELRDIVRSDDMDKALAGLLPRLEKAVLESEQRREARVNQTSTALNALVNQLQTLPLPKDVSKPLKSYAKQLDGRVGQSREIPLLLSELSALQGQALAHLEMPAEASRPGLLQRLFGSKDETPGPAAQASPALETPQLPLSVATDAVLDAVLPVAVIESTAVPAAVSLLAAVPAIDAAPSADIVPSLPPLATSPVTVAVIAAENPAPETVTTPLPSVVETPAEAPSPDKDSVLLNATPSVIDGADSADGFSLDALPMNNALAEALAATGAADESALSYFALPPSVEPTYSSVSQHIESTLLGLLNDLKLPERFQAQALAMCARLEHGLNWYELLPILDDLAVLVLAISNSGHHEFEAYLKQLNKRLVAFQSTLQTAHEDYSENLNAARELDTQLREHVDGLQSDVQEAVDLENLKQVLENRLEGLIVAMDQHQHQRDAREVEAAARLESLVDRVASMEREAQDFRDSIEVQRQKALVDSLTGLPNRAAWSERLDLEFANWQRDGSDLLLAMLDLDHFKRINDNYGHLAGDKVLKIIATELQRRLRPTDFIARFGGEEFVLLLPASKLEEGLQLLETLRAAIEACPFHFKGERVVITVSVGVTAFKSGERAEPVFDRADQALYRAKNAGRNRIESGAM